MMTKVSFRVNFKDESRFSMFEKSADEKSDECIGKFNQVDFYFDLPNYESLYKQEEMLMLREITSIDGKFNQHSMVYGSKISDRETGGLDEISVPFLDKNDFSNLKSILEKIGLSIVLVIEKRSKRYACRGIILSLDVVQGLEGYYADVMMVVEGNDDDVTMARAKMVSIVSDLLDGKDFLIDNRSYYDIILNDCKI